VTDGSPDGLALALVDAYELYGNCETRRASCAECIERAIRAGVVR
jgi:hypothetical protein